MTPTALHRMCSIDTSTSQGRRVTGFFEVLVFVFVLFIALLLVNDPNAPARW